jgi:hypothetical protein
MSENKVLRKILESKKDEVNEQFLILSDEIYTGHLLLLTGLKFEEDGTKGLASGRQGMPTEMWWGIFLRNSRLEDRKGGVKITLI